LTVQPIDAEKGKTRNHERPSRGVLRVPIGKSGAFDLVVEPHPYYPHLMAGPHRRRVARVGAPALTRHLVFWNPFDWEHYQPRSSRIRSRRIDEAISAVYQTLLALKRRRHVTNLRTNGEVVSDRKKMVVLFDTFMDARTGALHDREDESDFTGPDAHRTIKLLATWRGIPITIYFENHIEFVTATTILDLSAHIDPSALARLRARKRSIIDGLADRLDRIAAGDVGNEKEQMKIHAFLYRGVWSSFDREILTTLRNDKEKFGKSIADFRGLILGVNYDLRKSGAHRRTGQPIVAPPFTRYPTTGEKNLNEEFNPIWPRAEFDSIWKILTSGVNEEETEITASQFLDGRAFYATTLGGQSAVGSKPNPDPLLYLVYENTANMWQLGRLVHRIHFAGTYRTVATMHFEKLREVGGGLLQAGMALDVALSPTGAPDHGDEGSINKQRSGLRDHYQKVENPLMKLSRIRVDGPIYDRIERSRHYVDQFTQNAKALRIARIAGFQPYDEFVHQKLGSVYDYIDRLGRRYVQIQQDRTLLLRRLQALDALYEERVISDAQYVADVALLSILGPYYVGSLATHIVADPSLHSDIWLAAGAFGIFSFVPITLLRIWSRRNVLRGWQATGAFQVLHEFAAVVRSRLGRVLIAALCAAIAVEAARWNLLPAWLAGGASPVSSIGAETGADGGSRTRTPRRAEDFKSPASTVPPRPHPGRALGKVPRQRPS
jgi:hypothetical protein